MTSAEAIPTQTYTHLGKTNGIGLLTEALTADVETVFANDTSVVAADTAGKDTLACGYEA